MKQERKPTQAEEMALAAREGRQPLCVHCRHPLDKVSETQYGYITWVWNAEKGGYYQDVVVGDSDGPYHDCMHCQDGCQVHDPDFADNNNNDLIYY